MKIYGLKMHNFMRFGNVDNSIVFNVTKKQKEEIKDGKLTFDLLYGSLSSDPVKYIETVDAIDDDNVLGGIVGIAGMTAGSFDASNGSGKSTIFEAMAYAFYDKVVRQTANNDKKAVAGLSVVTKLAGVYPKDLKESYVEVYFEEDGRLYRLKRGRSFTKTKKSSSPIFDFDCIKDDEVDSLSSHRKRDTKKSLDEVIIEDYDIFVNTVMFGQADAGKFLTGTDKVKKDMIIELLKLEDIVYGCIDVIRDRKKTENGKLNSFTSRSNMLKSLVLSEYNLFKPVTCDEVEYSDELIDITSTYIGELLDNSQDKKKELNHNLEKTNKAINSLENSEILKSIKLLIENGKELVAQRKGLELKKSQDLEDWSKLIKESSVELNEWNASIENSDKKLQQKKVKLEQIRASISAIDRKDCAEKIAKCNEYIELQEKYEEQLAKARSKREYAIGKIAEFDTIINLRKKDLKSFNKQIEEAGDNDNFFCSECHSTVTKSHTLKKISAIEVVIKENIRLKSILDERNSNIVEALVVIENRLGVINEKKEEIKLLEDLILTSINNEESIGDLENQISAHEVDIEEKKKHVEKCNKKSKEYSEKHSSIEDKYLKDSQEISVRIDAKREEVLLLKEKTNAIEIEIGHNKKIRDEIKKDIASIENKCGSFQEKIDQLIDLGKKISEQEKGVKSAAKELQRYKILESAFGLEGVQTRIADKYLPLLNMYVKKFLDTLSDHKIAVNFFVNNKSKVDMEIVGGTAGNYVMLSGGEKMVVRLAVDIGLSLLSFSRTSRTPDMICLDEIFGPLDKDHTKSVFLMLETLKDRFDKVYLISHKREIQALIENNIIVEKSSGNRGLSRIVGIREVAA
jgi:DNA repair exonuclease SbcCD ATPase subunit